MYCFFRKDCDRQIPVSIEDINRIEKKFKITFPDVLKKYYLEHNGEFIHTVYIPIYYNDGTSGITSVHEIIPLINNESKYYNVEHIKEEEMNEPEKLGINLRVRNNFIPLAINQGGDIYYWDSNDEKVYISFNDDEDENGLEIPYYICSSVDEMFKLMNEAYEKEINNS